MYSKRCAMIQSLWEIESKFLLLEPIFRKRQKRQLQPSKCRVFIKSVSSPKVYYLKRRGKPSTWLPHRRTSRGGGEETGRCGRGERKGKMQGKAGDVKRTPAIWTHPSIFEKLCHFSKLCTRFSYIFTLFWRLSSIPKYAQWFRAWGKLNQSSCY